MITDVSIQTDRISHDALAHGGAGAMVCFEGRIREDENGRAIRALVYEAYQPMAERQMENILRELEASYPCLSVRVRHRIGEIPVGEAAIWVEVTASHRAEAFALASGFMERLKQEVPIWKMRAIPRDL